MPMNRIPTILVIDDNPTNRRLLRSFLEQDGYRVLDAIDGAPGVLLAREARPDLILLDVVMPGMSGLDACLQLSARPETSAIPIVLLSLRTGFPDEDAGRTAGAVEYLYKPFARADVTACVRRHVQGLWFARTASVRGTGARVGSPELTS